MYRFNQHMCICAEFIAKAEEIKGKGVDVIYCIASNDAFVVRVSLPVPVLVVPGARVALGLYKWLAVGPNTGSDYMFDTIGTNTEERTCT